MALRRTHDLVTLVTFLLGLAVVQAGCSSAEEPKPIPAPSDVAAPPADAQRTSSGLAWKVLTPGTGAAHPSGVDRVTVHYTGWTTDGRMFDTSVGGAPASFRLNGVIAGWTEGVQLMVAGEKSRFWIPADLAYGDHPSGGQPAGMLVFDIELIRIGS
jgi:FKBP-type peptidyl-prolyl cis-trans isomerase